MVVQEYERKQLLTAENYSKCLLQLVEKFTQKENMQINYYFDDADFSLNQKKETLRVRQIENSLKMERKYNKVYENGIRICDESSKQIDFLPKQIILENIKYGYIGNMVTIRKKFSSDDYTIYLDKNLYLGVCDHEIEIESNGIISIPEFVKDFFDSAKKIGKYSRFVNQLQNMVSELKY